MEETLRTPLDDCLRKFVVIEAGGIRYLGTLIEVGEEEVILKSPSRWIGVPIERITSIKPIDPTVLENAEVEQVDAEDYVPEEPPPPAAEATGETEAPPDDEAHDRPPATNK